MRGGERRGGEAVIRLPPALVHVAARVGIGGNDGIRIVDGR